MTFVPQSHMAVLEQRRAEVPENPARVIGSKPPSQMTVAEIVSEVGKLLKYHDRRPFNFQVETDQGASATSAYARLMDLTGIKAGFGRAQLFDAFKAWEAVTLRARKLHASRIDIIDAWKQQFPETAPNDILSAALKHARKASKA